MPLSFELFITNRHPGCICNEGFLGPHCELRESAELPKNPYANSLNEDDRSATESHRFYAVAFWVLLIASAMVVMFVVARAFWRRRLIERHAAVTSSIQWSPAFKDRGTKNNEINIAPGSTYSDLYEEAFSRSTVASTGRSSLRNIHTHEPFSDHDCKQEDDDINESDEECEEEQTAFSDQMHMEPRIDLGPPIDEDGHELHNVEIV